MTQPHQASDALRALSFGLDLGLFSRKRLPMVLQTEAAECSLACLAMVAAWHGRQVGLQQLRAEHAVSMKGATLAQVIQVAEQEGLVARPLRIELEDLHELQVPCILHWDMTHFVVLKEVKGNTLVIHDPAIGVRRMPLSSASAHFTGIALELSPAEHFEQKADTQKLTLRQTMGRITGLPRAITQIIAVALVLELCVLLTPYFMQLVVDQVAVTGDKGLLLTLVIGFGCLLLFQHCISAMRSWAILYLGTTMNLQWHSNVFSHLLRLPLSFFEKRHIGDVVSRFDSITAIQQTLTTAFIEAFLDGLLAVATLTMMLLYAPWLAAISVSVMLLYTVFRLLSVRPLMAASQEEIIHSAKQQTYFLETVRGARAVKLFNRERDRRMSWFNLLVSQTNAHVAVQRINIFFAELNNVLFGLERIAVIALAALMTLENKFTIGALFAYVAYKDQFAMRVSALIDKLISLRTMSLHVQRLGDIVTTTPEHGSDTRVKPKHVPAASLEVRNLSFRYADGEPMVVDNLSFAIQAGEFVAIVGPSGCGKTTLLKLMMGLLEPSHGTVLVGGIPVQKFGRRAYRSMIGAVTQDDQLFAGTIADNICFFDQEVDMDWLEECARMAQIHQDIEAMPMGYNTLIGDMGAALSGGQKQRIVLARALYKRPKILFLDEATSHLDVALEHAVNYAVSKLNITRVIVAHRPETIASAQRVIQLASYRDVEEQQLIPA
jgi:ATP-binding cassette, subfamily B, bacterial CvaB/MchF/RaxB